MGDSLSVFRTSRRKGFALRYGGLVGSRKSSASLILAKIEPSSFSRLPRSVSMYSSVEWSRDSRGEGRDGTRSWILL